MSERTFFTLRYALPGYTFILIFILVAYPTMLPFLQEVKDAPLIGAFLAFLYLLGGGTIGFLVSQPWYIIYNRYLVGRYWGLSELRELLRDEYHLREDIHQEVMFLDYLQQLADKPLLTYAGRRWDLMHTCGSTFFATIIASIFGLLIRANVFRIGVMLKEVIVGSAKAFESLSGIFANPCEIWMYDVGVILIVLFLLSVLLAGAYHASRTEAIALRFSVMKVVKSRRFPYWKARAVLPEDYFRDDEPAHV